MSATFPFNLPAPTVWYVLLYVATLLLHVAFMSYVLGGALALGVLALRRRLHQIGGSGALPAMARLLKDWMPSALSAAITAGIAPLLFVQILYQQEFYTANLLSFHRWMAILPVLIAVFYLLYLLKSRRLEGRAAAQGAVAAVVTACVLFVAWSWIENHLLSLDRAVWARQYETRAMIYASPAILPRLGFWIAGALPVWALLAGWQMRAGAARTTASEAREAAGTLAVVGAVATVAAAAAAWFVLRGPLAIGDAPPTTAEGALDAARGPWLAVAGVGAAVALAGWLHALRARSLAGVAFALTGAGTLAFWVGALLAREEVRWAVAGNPASLERHAEVGTSAGLVVFLVFTLLGVGATIWIFRTVARALRGGPTR